MQLFTGPIRIDVTFFMPIPSSLSLKKQKELSGQIHYIRPDLSNLIKYVEDVAQGVLFRDDSQIHMIIARKLYSDFPRTEFIIFEEPNEEDNKEASQEKRIL